MKESSKEIALAILRYLVDHPRSQDTVDGIERWWLLEDYSANRSQLVREALESLTQDQLVLKNKRANQQEHYRLNPEKIEEARKLIEKRKSDT